MVTKTRATVDDVFRLGEQGENVELIDGELVPMIPTYLDHAEIELQIGSLLQEFVRPRQTGKVFVGDPLFRLDPEGNLARAPDVAFISRERLRTQPNLRGAFKGAPDVAVEIVSQSNTAEAVHRKVHEWLAFGTVVVLVVYPLRRSIDAWRESGGLSLGESDEFNFEPAIPGFRCKVSDVFPPLLDEPQA